MWVAQFVVFILSILRQCRKLYVCGNDCEGGGRMRQGAAGVGGENKRVENSRRPDCNFLHAFKIAVVGGEMNELAPQHSGNDDRIIGHQTVLGADNTA